MSDIEAARRLLLVHAHPDDESIGTGATMAKYVAEDAHVCLVTCTVGEEGEILVPALEHLAADRDDALASVRIEEINNAMRQLGVTDHRFLGGAGRWRDSGMMGAPSNDRPDSFWQADLNEAAAQLVAIVREVRPQVIVTYDDNGFYGHPDHIQAHRVAWRAFEKCDDPGFGTGKPWKVSKFYATTVPRSVMEEMLEQMKDSNRFDQVETVDDFPFGVPDEQVTTEIDGRAYLDQKLAALRAYPTQISVDEPFFALSNNIGQQAFGTEHYILWAGDKGPLDEKGHETDLFAGLSGIRA